MRTTVHLLRHGEVHNPEKVLYGRLPGYYLSDLGHEMAERLGMTLFGRAANRHFLCYTGFERFDAEPEPRRAAMRVVAG